MTEQVYENPMWENARKALEAVSPQKCQNKQPEKLENGMGGPQQNMSAQEMYYQHLNNFKHSQGQGMPQQPP